MFFRHAASCAHFNSKCKLVSRRTRESLRLAPPRKFLVREGRDGEDRDALLHQGMRVLETGLAVDRALRAEAIVNPARFFGKALADIFGHFKDMCAKSRDHCPPNWWTKRRIAI